MKMTSKQQNAPVKEALLPLQEKWHTLMLTVRHVLEPDKDKIIEKLEELLAAVCGSLAELKEDKV
jgi:hypothetical protein